MYQTAGLDWSFPGWFSLALASLQLSAPNEWWMLAVLYFSSGLGYHLDSVTDRFDTCFTSPGPRHAVQPAGILVNLAFLFQPPCLPTYWSWDTLPCTFNSHLVVSFSPSPSFMVSFSWDSLFCLLGDYDTIWIVHYKGCEQTALRDVSLGHSHTHLAQVPGSF